MFKRTLTFLLIFTLIFSGMIIPQSAFADSRGYEPFDKTNTKHSELNKLFGDATTNQDGKVLNMYYWNKETSPGVKLGVMAYGNPADIVSGIGMTQEYKDGEWRIMGYNQYGVVLPNPLFPNDSDDTTQFANKNWILTPWKPTVQRKYTSNDNTKFSITKASNALQKNTTGQVFETSWLNGRFITGSVANPGTNDPVVFSAAELNERFAVLSKATKYNAGVAVGWNTYQ